MVKSSNSRESFERINQLSRTDQIINQHTRIAQSVGGDDKCMQEMLQYGIIEIEPRDHHTVAEPDNDSFSHTITNLSEEAIMIRISSKSSSLSLSQPSPYRITIPKGSSHIITVHQNTGIKSKAKILVEVLHSNPLLSPYRHILSYHPPSSVASALSKLTDWTTTSAHIGSLIPILSNPSSTPPCQPSPTSPYTLASPITCSTPSPSPILRTPPSQPSPAPTSPIVNATQFGLFLLALQQTKQDREQYAPNESSPGTTPEAQNGFIAFEEI